MKIIFLTIDATVGMKKDYEFHTMVHFKNNINVYQYFSES